MLWTIPKCYDSHSHLLATGMMQTGLRLFDLNSPEDIQNLKIEAEHFRGKWLVGFGWDQSKWTDNQYPTKEILDSAFPDFPVAFSRADGHATWLNSKALEAVGYLNKSEAQRSTPGGGVIVRDSKGLPTGVFAESAKLQVDLQIPEYSKEQQIQFLKAAIRYFNSRGFSHLRDMSGFITQWELLRELDLKSELTLYIDENFTCEDIKDFERALAEAMRARDSETKHLKVRGIKFYFDGALGSQGAFLSQFYPGTKSQGLRLWPLEDVKEVIEKTWRAGFEVCVHTIGDEAAHLILRTAVELQLEKKISGRLNLEHSEVIRNESIELMKSLSITCHMQPCHWLTDRRWLKEKLGRLYQFAFPWKALAENQIPVHWGSDSPIEEASVANNLKALEESSFEGIPAFPSDRLLPHSHPEVSWGDQCLSVFEDEKLVRFVFDGKEIKN